MKSTRPYNEYRKQLLAYKKGNWLTRHSWKKSRINKGEIGTRNKLKFLKQQQTQAEYDMEVAKHYIGREHRELKEGLCGVTEQAGTALVDF